MDTLTGLISLFVVVLTAHALEINEPSVAFMCNRPAMYLTAKGWIKDDSTDCMKDPVDILNYCRKVYPTLDVRNVVESSKKVTISKWCGFGHNKCHHEFTVRPFRCLVGSFQSDALLVPEHCLFDHIHDSKECKSYDDWNKTAQQSCADRGMVQQSFAILRPCGIDRFNGVEFVCCPHEVAQSQLRILPAGDTLTKALKESVVFSCVAQGLENSQVDPRLKWFKDDVEITSATSSRYYLESAGPQSLKLYVTGILNEDAGTYTCRGELDGNPAEQRVQLEILNDIDQFLHQEFEYISTTERATNPPTTTTTTEAATTTTTTAQPSSKRPLVASEQPSGDVYDKYLHNVAGQFLNEHEYFMKAKTQLEKRHHEAVTKMMKEWAEARQHVQDLKSVDPKGAEKLNKEITARFQKTYQALEQEGMSEKKQLVALHQQRVQAGLNEKKRHALEHYTDVLSEEEPETTHILKALEHYIKAEQKDRLHSINHFKHLRDTDPSEAEAVREQTLNHLDLIQARIQQAVDMLNRVPKYEAKIRQQIEDYLSTFQPLDTTVTKLLSTPISLDTANASPDLKPADVVIDYQDVKQVVPSLPDTPVTPLEGTPDLSEISPDSSEIDPLALEEQEEEDEDEEDEDSLEDEDDMFYEDELEDSEEEFDSEEDEDYEDSDEDLDDEDSEEEEYVVRQPPAAVPVATRKEFFDSESMENEHDYLQMKQPKIQHADNFRDGRMDVQSQFVQEERVDSVQKFSAPTLAVAIGSVTVFIVIVVGIVILRRRALRVPSNGHGFVEVDTAASPEEKHVANMQLNGYENPTYKYFEMNGNTA